MWSIFSSPVFWIGTAIVGLWFYGLYRGSLGKLPLFNMLTPQTLAIIGVVGFLMNGGIAWFGTLGTGSLTPSGSSFVSDLSEGTIGVGPCTEAVSASVRQRTDIRCLDVNANDTGTGNFVHDYNGSILTVTRDGELKPESFNVFCFSPDYASEASPGDGNIYNILEKNSLNEPGCFANDGAAAAETSPRSKAGSGKVTDLAFAEGDATSTLGVNLNIDEEGIDALNTYSEKSVKLWVGKQGKGMTYTYVIQALD